MNHEFHQTSLIEMQLISLDLDLRISSSLHLIFRYPKIQNQLNFLQDLMMEQYLVKLINPIMEFIFIELFHLFFEELHDWKFSVLIQK